MSSFVEFPEVTPEQEALINAGYAAKPVQAKFRCLSMTHRLLNGGPTTDVSVDLKPVIAKNKDWPGGSEENLKFWTATPSGEANVVYRAKPSDTPFEVGKYYYIDFTPATEGVRPWKLYKVEQSESQLDVHLGLAWDASDRISSATVTLGIQNRLAWAPFLAAGPGSKWSVSFSPAPAPEKDLATLP